MILQKVKMKKNTKLTFVCLLLVPALLLLLPTVFAQPMPLGIDGTVYDLDGITKAGTNVRFSIQDINSGYYIEGNLQNSGRYSSIIQGSSGDTVIVKVWNSFHNSSNQLTITGSMHGFDILLDLSVPEAAPEIVSSPILEASEDSLYLYDVDAVDENSDTLVYGLVEFPQNMSIDSTSGIITWFPKQEDVGSHNISVNVTDGTFTVDQEFTLAVINVNDIPIITSIPLTFATVGDNYSYAVIASDEDNDTLTYTLLSYPPGMQISPSGLLTWTPVLSQVGINNITLIVKDVISNATQIFTINVTTTENLLPVISSVPVTSAMQNSLYLYNLEAYDPEGMLLNFSFLKSPPGMTINSSGAVLWTPGNGNVGMNEVSIKIEDDFGYVLQNYFINVTGINDAPVFDSVPVTRAYLWNLYNYDADAHDIDGDNITFSLTQKPLFMTINKKIGQILWIPYQTGNFKVVISANDSKNITLQEYFITVEKKNNGNFFAAAAEFNGTANKVIVTNPAIDIMSLTYNSGKQDNITIYSGSDKIYLQGKPPKDRLYSYILTAMNDEAFETFKGVKATGKIAFRVKKSWAIGLSQKDIRLLYYNNAKKNWEALDTNLKKENWEYYFYESNINSLGSFAIVANVPKENLQKLLDQIFYKNQFEQPKRPFIVTGKVSIEGEEDFDTSGFDYEITNTRTGEKTAGKLKDETFADLISGNPGDDFTILIKKGTYTKEMTAKIDDDLMREDIVLDLTKTQYNKLIWHEKLVSALKAMPFFALFISIAVFIYLSRRRWK